ncbi:MAG: hypothetical protein ABFD08_16590 [Syntrophomonas sp.]
MELEDNATFIANELTNEKVIHVKFGTGVITSNQNRIIRIQFDESPEEKMFIYPDAFERFLKFQNPILEEKVQSELKIRNDQIAMEKEKDRIAAERREKDWRANIERAKLEHQKKETVKEKKDTIKKKKETIKKKTKK